MCCIAEMSSALPFAGGAWGITRVTLGFYPGYLIGCCEILQYTTWASVNFIGLVNLFEHVHEVVPFLWLLCIGISFFIHMLGSRVMWRLNAILAALSILILLIYCFGSLSSVNFMKYARYGGGEGGSWFVGGGKTAMKIFPIAAWPYVGVEATAFAYNSVESPQQVSQYIFSFFMTFLSLLMRFFFKDTSDRHITGSPYIICYCIFCLVRFSFPATRTESIRNVCGTSIVWISNV